MSYHIISYHIKHLSHRALSDMLLYPGETRNIRRGEAETNILGETGYNNISDKTPYAISVLPYPTITGTGGGRRSCTINNHIVQKVYDMIIAKQARAKRELSGAFYYMRK